MLNTSLRKRIALSFALALCATAGLGLGVASASASQSLGINQHLLWSGVDSAEVDRQLSEAVNLGAPYVRVDVGWQSLEESGKGNYSNWYLSKLDYLVNAANQRGVKLLATVTWTPCWASSAPAEIKQDCTGSWWTRGVQAYPPNNAGDYADAMAYLAARYRGRVAAWELWNEPNYDRYLKATDKPAAYAKLVKAAYPAVKAADPAATVLAGSLSGSDIDFTRALYAAGIKGSFDAFSIHPYSDDRSPLDTSVAARYTFINGVPGVHDVMVNNGDDKPLWLTEFGWSTNDTRNADAWDNGVSEETQATYLEQAVTQMTKWSFVPVAFWYEYKDSGTNPMEWNHRLGLTRGDNSQKPAYAAFKRSAASLAGASTSGGTTSGGTTSGGTTTKKPRGGKRMLRSSSVRPTIVSASSKTIKLKLRCKTSSKCKQALVVRGRAGSKRLVAGKGNARLNAGRTRILELRVPQSARRAIAREGAKIQAVARVSSDAGKAVAKSGSKRIV